MRLRIELFVDDIAASIRFYERALGFRLTRRFVATHEGLFRAAKGEERLERVGTSRHDTMGFTGVSHNTFLGSGHAERRGVRRRGLRST